MEKEQIKELVDQALMGIDVRFNTSVIVSPEDISPEKSIEYDLGFDSLDRVELVMNIEKKFDIFITDEEGDRVCGSFTIQDLYDLVDQKLKEKNN